MIKWHIYYIIVLHSTLIEYECLIQCIQFVVATNIANGLGCKNTNISDGNNWGSLFISLRLSFLCVCMEGWHKWLKIKGRFFWIWFPFKCYFAPVEALTAYWKCWFSGCENTSLVFLFINQWESWLIWNDLKRRNANEMIIFQFIVNYYYFFLSWIYDRKLDFLVCSQ